MDWRRYLGRARRGLTIVELRAVRLSQFVRGLSSSLLVGERTARKLPSTWVGFLTNGEDAAGRIVGFADRGPNRDSADECEFASRHPGCVNFLWADGHVSTIADNIAPNTYRQLAVRAARRS